MKSVRGCAEEEGEEEEEDSSGEENRGRRKTSGRGVTVVKVGRKARSEGIVRVEWIRV